MRVAISTDGDFVSAHFGRCPQFTIVDIENSQIVYEETINNPGHTPGLIPEFLNDKGVKCIIAGGMGGRAQQFFAQYGIDTIIGISGTVKDTVDKLVKGNLEGGESLCKPGAGKGYGVEKNVCDHPEGHDHEENNCN